MTFNITGWKIDSNQLLTKKVKPVFMNPIFFGFLLAIVMCMIIVYVLKDDDIADPGYKLLRLFVGISVVSAVFSFAHHSYLINKYEKILEERSPMQMIQNNNNINDFSPDQIPSLNDNNFGDSSAPSYNGIDSLTANNLEVNNALQQYGTAPQQNMMQQEVPSQSMYPNRSPGMQANSGATLGGGIHMGQYTAPNSQQSQSQPQPQYAAPQQQYQLPQQHMQSQYSQNIVPRNGGSGALEDGLNFGYPAV